MVIVLSAGLRNDRPMIANLYGVCWKHPYEADEASLCRTIREGRKSTRQNPYDSKI
jgi:hypothetical protein